MKAVVGDTTCANVQCAVFCQKKQMIYLFSAIFFPTLSRGLGSRLRLVIMKALKHILLSLSPLVIRKAQTSNLLVISE